MYLKMSIWLGLAVSFLFCVNFVELQGTGSGNNGNLRLCIAETRGTFKRGRKYCPTLDKENSGIECVIGVDRLDCLRRINKGTVDFGVFSPEDLLAAQWSGVEVLVVNEVKKKQQPFARSIVAVVNNRILKGDRVGLDELLRGTTLCHPATDVDDLRPLNEAVTRYMESLVTSDQCDPNVTLAENRIKATAAFFKKACMAGTWVPDPMRDNDLKRRYPSLCAACARTCFKQDHYWGDVGALNCMYAGAGDVTWVNLDTLLEYFQKNNAAGASQYSLLCRDGRLQPLNATQPCVWLNQPWNVIVAKRKAAEAVSAVTSSLTNSSLLVDGHWHGALAGLLGIRQALPPPLQPAQNPMDYLATASGFREAYSQHGCNPPRHITLCTTSILEYNKCEWLSEAGAVNGVLPPLQCVGLNSTEQCLRAVAGGNVDAVVAGSDWLIPAVRNFSVNPVLHEATPIINDLITISAYVRKDSGIKTISELRNKRAAFPSFDGLAWHSALRYLKNHQKDSCKNIANTFFSSVCAAGIEKFNAGEKKIEQYTNNCYKNSTDALSGEESALRSLVEGKSDVAFISMRTYNLYKANHFREPWAKTQVDLVPVCPDENPRYCFLSWTNIGHVFVSNNVTNMKKQEIVNVMTSLDQLFGDHAHQSMFSMYGPFNHQIDVLFHNNTKALNTNQMFEMRPYSEYPLAFDYNFRNDSGFLEDICKISDFTTGFGSKFVPFRMLVWTLVLCALLVY